jgi:hypothetical protein
MAILKYMLPPHAPRCSTQPCDERSDPWVPCRCGRASTSVRKIVTPCPRCTAGALRYLRPPSATATASRRASATSHTTHRIQETGRPPCPSPVALSVCRSVTMMRQQPQRTCCHGVLQGAPWGGAAGGLAWSEHARCKAATTQGHRRRRSSVWSAGEGGEGGGGGHRYQTASSAAGAATTCFATSAYERTNTVGG